MLLYYSLVYGFLLEPDPWKNKYIIQPIVEWSIISIRINPFYPNNRYVI